MFCFITVSFITLFTNNKYVDLKYIYNNNY